jgi:putative methyltransferase (TIGR04325 family)
VILRAKRVSQKGNFTWEGIYSHRCHVPTNERSYDDEIEVKKHLEWTSAALELVNTGKQPHLPHNALALLAAITSGDTNAVSVLDIGGAVGAGYVQLRGSLPKSVAIQYKVVDLPKMCEAGRQLFNGDASIQFHSSIPDLSNSLNIVYASAVLPYIDDYCGFLRELASLEPKFILLGQLAAGDIPTFATKQVNLTNKVLAYWFLNRGEVITSLAAAGYNLIYDRLVGQEYDQSNFPRTHRIGRMREMLFRRS